MKKWIIFNMVFCCLLGVAFQAEAAFEQENLIMTVYHPEDNEVGLDLGNIGDIIAAAQAGEEKMLRAAGTSFKLSDFGDKVAGDWSKLHFGIYTAYVNVAAEGMWLFFATSKQEVPLVNYFSLVPFSSGSTGMHSKYNTNDDGTGKAVVVASGQQGVGLQGYDIQLNKEGELPGAMAGFHTGDSISADPGMGPLDGQGHVIVYLWGFSAKFEGLDAVGDLLEGFPIAIRVNADGSVALTTAPPANAEPEAELVYKGTTDPVPANLTLDAGDPLELELRATDADAGDTLSLNHSLPAAVAVSDVAKDGDTWVWTIEWASVTTGGQYQLSVTDGEATTNKALNITVNGGAGSNRAPTVTPVSPINVNVNSPVSFEIRATDADGDDVTLTYNDSAMPDGYTLTDPPLTDGDDTVWTFNWTPSDTQGGSYQLPFTLSDGEAGTTLSVSIYVDDGTNTAPTLAPVNAISAGVGETVTFDITATDPDADTLTISTDPDPLPGGISQAGPSTSGDNTVWTYVWTPSQDQGGQTYTLKFTVSDGKAEVSRNVGITVNASGVNHPPELASLLSQSVSEGSWLSFSLSATDPDNDRLTYSVSGAPGNATLVNGFFQWKPGYDQAGAYTLTFTVSDGRGESDSQSMQIQVINTNAAPVMQDLAHQQVATGSTLTLKLRAEDSDDSTGLTYYCNGCGMLPGDAQLAGDTFNWAVPDDENAAGNYWLDFYARDRYGLRSANTLHLAVTVGDGNRPPDLQPLTSGNSWEVVEGVTLAFTVSAIDSADTVTYDYIAYGVTGENFDQGTGEFSWTPQPGDASGGPYTITFIATDSLGLSDEMDVTIVVKPNRLPGAPTIHSPAYAETVTNRHNVRMTVNNAVDPDISETQDASLRQTLSYVFQVVKVENETATPQWSGSSTIEPNAAAILIGQTTTRCTLSGSLEDNSFYRWRARAGDGVGSGPWVESLFFVNEANDPPGKPKPISPLGDMEDPGSYTVFKEFQPTLRIANAEDADNDALYYEFEIYPYIDGVVMTDTPAASAVVPEGLNITDGSRQTAWIVPADQALYDNTAYCWRVRAVDMDASTPGFPGAVPDNDESWTDYQVFVIDQSSEAPNSPVQEFPVDGEEITTRTPTLTIRHMGDPDAADAPVYYFELVKRSDGAVCDFSVEGVLASPAVPEGRYESQLPDVDGGDGWVPVSELNGVDHGYDPDYTGWSASTALQDNTFYCWRVWAEDSDGNKSEIVESSFFVNEYNEVPPTPIIVSPEDMDEVTTLQPILTVQPVVDLDHDAVTYEFVVKDSAGSEVARGTVNDEPSWQVPVTLANGRMYTWQVRAYDEHAADPGDNDTTETSDYSQWSRFTVHKNDLPPVPEINSPAIGQTLRTLQPTLSIKQLENTDGDILTVEFEVYTDRYFNPAYRVALSPRISAGELLTTWTVEAALNDKVTYWWRARVYDTGSETPSAWQSGMFKIDTAYTGWTVTVAAAAQVTADSTETQIIEVTDDTSPVYGVEVVIPPNAVLMDVTLTIGWVDDAPTFEGGGQILGKALELGPNGYEFERDIYIRIPYTETDLLLAGLTDPADLGVYYYNGVAGTWERLEVTEVDTEARKIQCTVRHFSMYAKAHEDDGENTPNEVGGGSAASDDGGNCFIGATGAPPLAITGAVRIACIFFLLAAGWISAARHGAKAEKQKF